MKKWSKYIYYLFAVILLLSCTHEDDLKISVDSEEEESTIQIEFASPMGESTRAMNENGIDRLDILVFTPPTAGASASTADRFDYRITKTGVDITTVNANTKKVTASLKRNNEQRLILLANIPAETIAWLESNLTEGVTTLAGILPYLTYSGSPWGENHLTQGETALPMWGQENSHSTILPTGTPAQKTIKMIRSVSKINVKIDENDPPVGYGSLFTLDSIYICNAVPNGYISPPATELHLEQMTVPFQNTSGTRVDLGYVLNDSIYVPECDSLIGGNTPAYMVIKAQFNAGNGLEPYFYKIDLKNGTQSVPLLRNYSYSVVIKDIRTRGYTTLSEAKAAPASNGNAVTVVIGDGNVEEVRIDHIIYNDQYMLGAEAKGIKLDWMRYTASDPYKLPVLTTYSGGWTASVVEGGAWLSLTSQSGIANQVNYLDLVTTGPNDGLVSRTGIIAITAGSLTLNVEITQIIGSNSYVISGSNSVTIPINSANLGDTRVSSTTTELEVRILWQQGDNVTLSVPMTIFDGDDTFAVTKTGSGTSANAVIGLVKPGGPGMVGGLPGDEILWSWHVWVTSSSPDISTNIKTNNGYLFMDRNLGSADDSGVNLLYYQWGRKDPFYNDGTNPLYTVEFVQESDNLATAIKNPTVFYKTSSTPLDWIGSSQINTLWVTSEGEKGDYDPCPFGWRVPVSDAYSGISNGKNGINIPLAGSLAYGSGTRSGSEGYVWTATAGGYRAWGYSFSNASANGIPTSSLRATGKPIRCVRDVKK